jgi:predicted alpha/beta superfamily hydrolase
MESTDTKPEAPAPDLTRFMARHTAIIEPPRRTQVPGFAWQHEVQVALPPSYASSDRAYPVVWLTDGSAIFRSAVELATVFAMDGTIPEVIVVGFGSEPTATLMEVATRRNFDFTTKEDVFPAGLGGERMRATAAAAGVPVPPGGGAPALLDHLVDVLRPELTGAYRMDSERHVLFGHSGGGTFVGYSLFARPGAFQGYICGSPFLNASDGHIFQLEDEYAQHHTDLPAAIYFGIGEQELASPLLAAHGLGSSMLRLAETLLLRGYPSLRVVVRVSPGETHPAMYWPLLSEGLREVFRASS